MTDRGMANWLRDQPLKTRMRFSRMHARAMRKHRRWKDHHDWYNKHLARLMTEAIAPTLRQPIEERAFYDTIEIRINGSTLG